MKVFYIFHFIGPTEKTPKNAEVVFKVNRMIGLAMVNAIYLFVLIKKKSQKVTKKYASKLKYNQFNLI